jgi:C-terminal processing protease CtpA/Prc
MTIDAATRRTVIEAVLKELKATYVFPETANNMVQAIDSHVAAGQYDAITSAKALARRLTADLRDVCHDKHLRVRYSAETLPGEPAQGQPAGMDIAKMREEMARVNFGFEKIERLNGNIGYLDLRGFVPASVAGETAAAAMNFLANTDALIIDLRQNGGGSPDMVALLCSYLFPPGEPVHLNDLYFRPRNTTQQWWTQSYVPGARYVDKPVYVLTSKNTFSAAEECTYNLKCLKRATIVGEVTGGGAHPGDFMRVHDHFGVWVPQGRAINPITKTNWEGTGVKPDVEVPASLALATAHLAALDRLLEKNRNKSDEDRLKSARILVQKQLDSQKSKSAGATKD